MPITLGFKAALCSENGIIPQTSFIGHVTTSVLGSKVFKASHIAPSFRFTMQHTLSDKLALAYNLGAEWNGETPVPSYLYTLTLGLSISPRLGGFAEVYGFMSEALPADHRLDAGFTYLVNNNVMLDISGGVGLTEEAPNNFVSLGLSYRFNVVK